MEFLHASNLGHEFGLDRGGEHGAAVFVPFSFADQDFVGVEVDVFDSQPERFEQPKPAAVEDAADELVGAIEFGEDPELDALVAAWPTLPEPIRRAMLALIRSAMS